MIKFKGKDIRISPVVISTIFGHAGNGMFPLVLKPSYRKLLSLAKETKTTILTKSSTRYKKIGNYRPRLPWTWRVIRNFGADGMINAYGLTNNGVLFNAEKIAEALRQGYNVMPNYHPELFKGEDRMQSDIDEAIDIYSNALVHRFKILEINFSCPNIKEDIKENIDMAVQCVKWSKVFAPNLVLIAKISIAHPYELAQELEKAGVDIIHAVNSVPYNVLCPDINKQSPLHKYGGGGVSGGPVNENKLVYNYNAGLRLKVNTHLIMGCGINSLYAAKSYKDIGADSISICTVVKRNPKEAEKIILEYNM
ncbi:hypothetical protein KKC83_00070 [Patescibacteria group bacterium]|nr:hypothetical protein [Candidatus Falkowbacteria bacterium]MBU3906070.1 hypothetical protein [Patescibacteria group bacterium]MCG2698043.1 hypothetical protein [Candidatus Parcubacteria bacterium]MBU4015152.1 hypothetical protein [Patescibacteria group bacterium]MBU4025936.1 hypothetical protein [Patescibacteria group bacterium]